MKIRGATLCSGIDAPKVAAPHIEWVWCAEIEKFPSAVLHHYGPSVPNLGDILARDFIERASALGSLDVLVAGTPCQAFSVAGLRRSLADERGNLTLRFVEIVHALNPRIVVWENVPGVLNTHDNAFGCFLGALVGADSPLVPARGQRWTDAGVVAGPERVACWRVLDAQYSGLAQRRERVYVVADSGNGCAAEILFERESVPRYPPSRGEAGQDVAGSLSARSQGGGGLGTDFECQGGLVPDVAFCLNAGATNRIDGESGTFIIKGSAIGRKPENGPQYGEILEDGTCYTLNRSEQHAVAHSLRADGFDASEDGTGRGTPLVPVTVGPLTACGGTAKKHGYGSGQQEAESGYVIPTVAFHSRQDPIISDDEMLPLEAKQGQCVAFSCKDHGADASDIAPTLRSMGHDGSHANGGGQIAVAHSLNGNSGRMQVESTYVPQRMAVRRLTPRECERLQGFPDDYTLINHRGKPAADGPRYKALGNSMAVPVVGWILGRIERTVLS